MCDSTIFDDIFARARAIPGARWIEDDDRSELAVVQAASCVDAGPFAKAALHHRLTEPSANLRTSNAAAAARVPRGALILADEDVMLVTDLRAHPGDFLPILWLCLPASHPQAGKGA